MDNWRSELSVLYFWRKTRTRQLSNTDFWNTIQKLSIYEGLNLFVPLDGCSLHRTVRHWQNEHFPNPWINCGSPLKDWLHRNHKFGFLFIEISHWDGLQKPPKWQKQNCACTWQLQNVIRNTRKRDDKCIELDGQLVQTTIIWWHS